MLRLLAMFATLAALLSGPAKAATVITLDPEFGGRVSRGGIVQQTFFNAGFTRFYGDIFRFFAVFDASLLPATLETVQSASLIITGGTLSSLQDERLIIGSMTGALVDFDKTALPGNAAFPTDRSLYPRTNVTSYGDALLVSAPTLQTFAGPLTYLPDFMMALNSTAIADIETARSSSSGLFGVAGMIERPYELNATRSFDAPAPTGVRLSLSFAATEQDAPDTPPLTPVPLPGSASFLLIAIAAFGVRSFIRDRAAQVPDACNA